MHLIMIDLYSWIQRWAIAAGPTGQLRHSVSETMSATATLNNDSLRRWAPVQRIEIARTIWGAFQCVTLPPHHLHSFRGRERHAVRISEF